MENLVLIFGLVPRITRLRFPFLIRTPSSAAWCQTPSPKWEPCEGDKTQVLKWDYLSLFTIIPSHLLSFCNVWLYGWVLLIWRAGLRGILIIPLNHQFVSKIFLSFACLPLLGHEKMLSTNITVLPAKENCLTVWRNRLILNGRKI